jgi:hypothetical protein
MRIRSVVGMVGLSLVVAAGEAAAAAPAAPGLTLPGISGGTHDIFALSIQGTLHLAPASADGDDEDDVDGNGSRRRKGLLIITGATVAGLALFSEFVDGSDRVLTSPPDVVNNPPANSGDPTGGGPNGDGGNGGPEQLGITADPQTVTPEPVSMTLLATGLAGLGGMQLRRRRKESIQR